MSPLPNDSTKIFKSCVPLLAFPYHTYANPSRSIPFNDQDFIQTATRWTKSRIFPSSSPSSSPAAHGGPGSPPPISNSPISLAASDPAHYYARPTIELCQEDGTFLVAYSACAQLWEFDEAAGGYCVTGSTFGINGKVISAHFVRRSPQSPNDTDEHVSHVSRHPNPNYVVLQVVRREDIHLEVHQLNKKPSFVQTLVLPPASSGPGPYSVYTRHTDKCFAVITKAGAVTLFSVPDFHPMPLSGLETAVNSDGLPLFDICGRWLVYSPIKLPSQTVYTPLKLPPPGLLLDRILENISTTTAASLKTLSDAGVAGLRHYLSKDTPQPSKAPTRTSNNVIYVGKKKFETSALPQALSSLFTGSKSQPIQIMDLETQAAVSTFASPQGLSFLSLSPHDAVLATVSAKGENVYTFDLSFVPRQVSLSGKYSRGKTPGKVSHVEWDSEGGFGIITSDKGSVHWFERLPWNTYESQVESEVGGGYVNGTNGGAAGSSSSSSKIWRLSGWSVSSMCMIPDAIGCEVEPKARDDASLLPRESSRVSLSSDLSLSSGGSRDGKNSPRGKPANDKAKNQIAMLREGEILIVSAKTGTCSWKYDIPSMAISETFLSTVLNVIPSSDADSDNSSPDSRSCSPELKFRRLSKVEPLSFYEMETCLPYPFLHTDRHILLSTYENDENVAYSEDWVFGNTLKARELDFGMAKGLANFEEGFEESANIEIHDGQSDFEVENMTADGNGDMNGKDGIPWEKKEELMRAMESMVITP